MAELDDILPDNIAGKFYVDRQCIDCDVCRDTSPAHFSRSDDNGYSYVSKQPETEEEFALCNEALIACPVEAIGDDGSANFGSVIFRPAAGGSMPAKILVRQAIEKE